MLLVLNLLRAVLAGIRRLYGALLSCLGFLSSRLGALELTDLILEVLLHMLEHQVQWQGVSVKLL